MTGWNLPPGCSVRDIPGNRPEDEAQEALLDELYEQIAKHLGGASADEAVSGPLAEWYSTKIGEAYRMGYEQGISDERMAQEYNRDKDNT